MKPGSFRNLNELGGFVTKDLESVSETQTATIMYLELRILYSYQVSVYLGAMPEITFSKSHKFVGSKFHCLVSLKLSKTA